MEDPHSFAKIVKNKTCISLNILVVFFLVFQAIANEFVSGLGDIPIFKEMRNVEESLVLFDKVEGRYLYSETEGEYNKNEISQFYKNVLPNLGWEFKEANIFERGNETLEIKYKEYEKITKALFSISPKKN